MRIDKVNLYRTNRFLSTANKSKPLNNCRQNINGHSDLLIPSNIPFMRKWEEHKSWGANYDKKTYGTSFKVLVHSGVKTVDVEVKRGDEYVSYPLEKKGKGIFETKEPIKGVLDGDRYHYVLRYPDGYTERVKDPCSFKQPELLGDSEVYDQSKYEWQHNDEWKSNKNRVSRLADEKNKLKSVEDLRIYEINCASLTQKGDFDAAKSAVKKAYCAGFNAIEIMPVENTFSFNWGYDGVDKFAVSEYLGGPDELKSLIDYCHGLGINVIIDMVPNHIGPDGERLMSTGPYLKDKNIFGYAYNFENNESEYVRDYIVNAALNWIDNYHCDGLRLDMTKYMDSDITMRQIATEINYHNPETFLIAEDAREHTETTGERFWTNNNIIHDERIVYPLKPEDIGNKPEEQTHEAIIEGIANLTPNALSEPTQKFIAKLGYDSEWDFPFYHSLHDYLFGGKKLEELVDIVYASKNRVKYVMSHDEIGNCEGTRLIQKLVCERLQLNRYIPLDDNDWKRSNDYYNLKNQNDEKKITTTEAKETIENQKAQLIAGKLVTMMATGDLKSDEDIYALGIDSNSHITVADVKKAYDAAFATQKNALAFTYAIPGPKMVFQGDENSDLTPFRFFRRFSDKLYGEDEKTLFIEKGYTPGEPALKESKLGGIKYSDEYNELMRKSIRLTKFLNKFNNKNGQIIKEKTITHAAPKVLGLNIKNDAGEYFIVSNFSDTDYPNPEAGQYYIDFPVGEWKEILNTDDTKYGGKGEHHNRENLVSKEDFYKIPINLPANSTLYFQKVEAPKDSANIEQS